MSDRLDIISTVEQRVTGQGRQVIFVCGLGGSGKTTFCMAYQSRLGGSIVSIDWYLIYPTLERKERIRMAVESGDSARIEAEENPLHWYDWSQFLSDIQVLRQTGKLTIKNAWDQKTGKKDLSIHIVAEPNSLIWCDGIYLLSPPVAKHADLIILLETSIDIARKRYELRDQHRTTSEYLKQKDRLARQYDVPYFETYSKEAGIIISYNDPANPELIKA